LPAPARLTKREAQILALIGSGHSSDTIGRKLGITHFTVRKHRSNIASKFGLHSAAQFIAFAVQHGDAVPAPAVLPVLKEPQEPRASLSPREFHVLQLLAQGLGTKEIAKKLAISPRTVSKHRENMMIKCGVHTTAALIRAVLIDGN
jgi:DNA-binding CsgD family transcriptional regulator